MGLQQYVSHFFPRNSCIILPCFRRNEQIKCRQWRCGCKGFVACGISFRWLTWRQPGLWVSHCHLCLVIEPCQFFYYFNIGELSCFMTTLSHCLICVGKLPCSFFSIAFFELMHFKRFELLASVGKCNIGHNYWLVKGVSYHYSDTMPIHIHYGQITSTLVTVKSAALTCVCRGKRQTLIK